MKHRLLTTIAAGVLVGCGEPSDFHKAAGAGNLEAVKQHLAAGADVNTKDAAGMTPLDFAIIYDHPETADLLRKYEARVKEELKPQKK